MEQKAFTIIELIISVFILSIAIVGIFNAFAVIVILTSDSADRLTAAYLAQEGIEVARNIRDTNWFRMDFCVLNPDDANCLTPPIWIDFFDSCGSGCKMDFATNGSISNPVLSWTNNASDYLYEYSGIYSQPADTTAPGMVKTKFKRKITTSLLPDGYQIPGEEDHILKITVKVSWDTKRTLLNSFLTDSELLADADSCPQSHCVEVQEILYNWYNYVE